MKGADTGFLKGALLEAKPDAVLFLILLAGGGYLRQTDFRQTENLYQNKAEKMA